MTENLFSNKRHDDSKFDVSQNQKNKIPTDQRLKENLDTREKLGKSLYHSKFSFNNDKKSAPSKKSFMFNEESGSHDADPAYDYEYVYEYEDGTPADMKNLKNESYIIVPTSDVIEESTRSNRDAYHSQEGPTAFHNSFFPGPIPPHPNFHHVPRPHFNVRRPSFPIHRDIPNHYNKNLRDIPPRYYAVSNPPPLITTFPRLVPSGPSVPPSHSNEIPNLYSNEFIHSNRRPEINSNTRTIGFRNPSYIFSNSQEALPSLSTRHLSTENFKTNNGIIISDLHNIHSGPKRKKYFNTFSNEIIAHNDNYPRHRFEGHLDANNYHGTNLHPGSPNGYTLDRLNPTGRLPFKSIKPTPINVQSQGFNTALNRIPQNIFFQEKPTHNNRLPLHKPSIEIDNVDHDDQKINRNPTPPKRFFPQITNHRDDSDSYDGSTTRNPYYSPGNRDDSDSYDVSTTRNPYNRPGNRDDYHSYDASTTRNPYNRPGSRDDSDSYDSSTSRNPGNRDDSVSHDGSTTIKPYRNRNRKPQNTIVKNEDEYRPISSTTIRPYTTPFNRKIVSSTRRPLRRRPASQTLRERLRERPKEQLLVNTKSQSTKFREKYPIQTIQTNKVRGIRIGKPTTPRYVYNSRTDDERNPANGDKQYIDQKSKDYYHDYYDDSNVKTSNVANTDDDYYFYNNEEDLGNVLTTTSRPSSSQPSSFRSAPSTRPLSSRSSPTRTTEKNVKNSIPETSSNAPLLKKRPIASQPKRKILRSRTPSTERPLHTTTKSSFLSTTNYEETKSPEIITKSTRTHAPKIKTVSTRKRIKDTSAKQRLSALRERLNKSRKRTKSKTSEKQLISKKESGNEAESKIIQTYTENVDTIKHDKSKTENIKSEPSGAISKRKRIMNPKMREKFKKFLENRRNKLIESGKSKQGKQLLSDINSAPPINDQESKHDNDSVNHIKAFYNGENITFNDANVDDENNNPDNKHNETKDIVIVESLNQNNESEPETFYAVSSTIGQPIYDHTESIKPQANQTNSEDIEQIEVFNSTAHESPNTILSVDPVEDQINITQNNNESLLNMVKFKIDTGPPLLPLQKLLMLP